METIPVPTLESELPTGLYTEEERGEILARIEAVAGADRLAGDEVFKPKKSGILFPVVINIAAVVLIVGAWFTADSYYQTRQQGLTVRTEKLFSAESKLLAKVLEDSKAQMDAANAEIGKIQGDLAKAAADKANLQKTFEDRVSAQDKALRQELSSALDLEKKRLQASGISETEVTRRLADFENSKNTEFNSKLDAYRKQAQAEIDQRAVALTSLQAKLQSTVTEQDKLRQDIEKQTKEREGALQAQLSSQSADIDALKKERDDLGAFYRQSDTSLSAIKAAFESHDWTKTQSAVDSLRQVLGKAALSNSEAVRARAQAQGSLADVFDNALVELNGSASKSEALNQIEAVKTQAKKDLAAAAVQLVDAQQQLAASEGRWRQASGESESLRTDVDELVKRLDGSTTETFEARNDAQYLEAKVSELQQTVDDLTPYKERAEALSKLFAAKYPTADEQFKTTFLSPQGVDLFPGFDTAWTALIQQTKDAGTVQSVRKKALDDVLAFTTYLRGLSANATSAREAATNLSRSDEDYKNVVESIQSLANSGVHESGVITAKTQLYGTVAAASSTKVVLEPLTKVRPQIGQLIELRRIVGKKETSLGRGSVITASNTKVEIDWTGNSTPALSGDAAYLVLN